MIEEIAIRDLGVIDDAVLPLGPGFTAITGETGAGKTMVVTALGLLLGERADSAAVRSGSPQAWIEGRWSVPADGEVAQRVRDAGGTAEAYGSGEFAEVLLARSVSPEGRSRALVGGRAAPVGVLTELGEHLVVVHGQSEQVRLRSAVAQREALDRFGGEPLQAALAQFRLAFEAWRTHREELDILTAEQERRAGEAEELRSALTEIEQAAPEPGEDERLAEQAERLTNLEELRIAAATAREAVSAELGEGADVVGLLDAAQRAIERVAAHDAALSPIVDTLANASYLAADAAGALSSYLAGLDGDGARDLELLQGRRAELGSLVRKYGPTLDDVLQTQATGSERLIELEGDSERIEGLRERVGAELDEAQRLAGSLSGLRRDAAARLGERVSEELAALAMADARLSVEVTGTAELGRHGSDQVGMLLQPHPGAEPRPLGRGASGGELSRVMLAIEVVMAGTDPVPTFVFDEIDAGVGGASAIEIGRRLARLAETAQVIVVTHLAQVAAFARNHLSVVKDGAGTVTASSVRALDGEERVAEMARLLSGLPDSETGLSHARELLDLAATAPTGTAPTGTERA